MFIMEASARRRRRRIRTRLILPLSIFILVLSYEVNSVQFVLQALPKNDRCGGCTVPYLLASFLETLGASATTLVWANGCSHINTCISAIHGPIPEMVMTEVLRDTYVDSNTVVVYGEGVRGNPFLAKHVVRWILAPPWIWEQVGLHDNYNTWNQDDIVVHWTTFSAAVPDTNVLYFPFLPPGGEATWLSKNSSASRSGACYTVRKGRYFHQKKYLRHLIAQDRRRFGTMTEIKNENTFEIHAIFQKSEYFISYDPFTHLTVLAALSGCVSVVRPVYGLSKAQWLEQTVGALLRHLQVADLAGVAYDWSDVPYAKRTLSRVHDTQKASKRYGLYTVLRFLNEIENLMVSNKTNFLRVRDVWPIIKKAV